MASYWSYKNWRYWSENTQEGLHADEFNYIRTTVVVVPLRVYKIKSVIGILFDGCFSGVTGIYIAPTSAGDSTPTIQIQWSLDGILCNTVPLCTMPATL
jgi:hypothetical protein